MRGEHRSPASSCVSKPGSSPHARGAPNLKVYLSCFPGIIPACAGSTTLLSLVRVKCQGSSPHARGAHRLHVCRALPAGIIPACAGSTCVRKLRSWPGRDHPRMRGEHQSFSIAGKREGGSSPHARGAQPGRRQGHRLHGIIPACAGSTAAPPLGTTLRRDHPRMRGEHACATARIAATTWIIPACAGSTPNVTPNVTPRQDHPRMRGEHPGR